MKSYDLLGHAAFVDVGERWVGKWAEGQPNGTRLSGITDSIDVEL